MTPIVSDSTYSWGHVASVLRAWLTSHSVMPSRSVPVEANELPSFQRLGPIVYMHYVFLVVWKTEGVGMPGRWGGTVVCTVGKGHYETNPNLLWEPMRHTQSHSPTITERGPQEGRAKYFHSYQEYKLLRTLQGGTIRLEFTNSSKGSRNGWLGTLCFLDHVWWQARKSRASGRGSGPCQRHQGSRFLHQVKQVLNGGPSPRTPIAVRCGQTRPGVSAKQWIWCPCVFKLPPGFL